SVHKEQDGSLLLITALPLESWMVWYILSFGSSVEVLEPAILRQAVIDQAKNITSLYKP
ncbi:MAG: WYL domain-containing protein, partial [Sphaerochaetaceae bacterium]